MAKAYPMMTTERDVFRSAREQLRGMERHLESEEAFVAEHHELEAYVVREGRELQRRLFQAHLDLRAAREQRVEVEMPTASSAGAGPPVAQIASSFVPMVASS